MKVALDTSVLVAGLVEAHEHFARAAPWLDALGEQRISTIWTVHAYAETWSVLTRLPLAERLLPGEASAIVDALAGICEPVAVTLEDYRAAAERCAIAGARSGAIFDALHLVCAEREGVDALLTFNERDLLRLSPSIPIRAPSGVLGL